MAQVRTPWQKWHKWELAQRKVSSTFTWDTIITNAVWHTANTVSCSGRLTPWVYPAACSIFTRTDRKENCLHVLQVTSSGAPKHQISNGYKPALSTHTSSHSINHPSVKTRTFSFFRDKTMWNAYIYMMDFSKNTYGSFSWNRSVNFLMLFFGNESLTSLEYINIRNKLTGWQELG